MPVSLDILPLLKKAWEYLQKIDTLFRAVLVSLAGVLGSIGFFSLWPGLSQRTTWYALTVLLFVGLPEAVWAFRRLRPYFRQAFSASQAEPSHEVALAIWGVVILCAFLSLTIPVGWGLANSSESTATPSGAAAPTAASVSAAMPTRQTGVAGAEMSQTVTPAPSSAPPPTAPSSPPPPTPTIIATKIDMERHPPDMPQLIVAYLNQSPSEEMYYWAIREDLGYPGRNPHLPELYPQGPPRSYKSNPYLRFDVFLPLVNDRTYRLSVLECNSEGDAVIKQVAEQGSDAFLNRLPPAPKCKCIGEQDFAPLK